MSNEKSRFNVGAYIPHAMHGYPVRLNDYSWHVALFVVESEAQHFANYATAQLHKHNTTDMAQWDAPVSEAQPDDL